MKAPRHAVGAIRIDQRRSGAGDVDILHGAEHHKMRSDAFAGGDAAVECHQGIENARRTRHLSGPFGAVELRGAASTAAARKIIGDMRLVVAQHIDAENAVLEHRGGDRAAMMNADQQSGLRRIG